MRAKQILLTAMLAVALASFLPLDLGAQYCNTTKGQSWDWLSAEAEQRGWPT